ncbi:oxidoreductase [Rhizobium sp. RM]|uniref:oxidoreductase n=1 Tax=Rhizobium sp. RM TaxID=2748079 RepID=UPI00110F0F8C|nr:oxidoreductase [Rhizobium sp. RM]NWJ27752.1 SDR family NAD(P)-dependent oxidoreductase [Rhizobium sp. RM]TMV21907.1 SDR family NAD(P)-dependent oxidoreductase [Rhizobium sp. Td3]
MVKRWLVTGSSRGLGRALVEAALESGDQVVATARNVDALKPLVEKHATRVVLFPLDVSDPIAADDAVQFAKSSFGGLDVVVNNAGYGNVSAIEDTHIEEMRREIETNLFGTIIVTKAVIALMREQRHGHIINVSSVGGRLGSTGRASYSTAKWGVEGFSEVLAQEMALVGVKVTIIEPGGFRTDFAGSSTELREGRPEYDAVVGAAARFQRDYNGRQPGDPAKAAQVILKIAQMENPPSRLALGSDALAAIRNANTSRRAELEKWASLSSSTDFEG